MPFPSVFTWPSKSLNTVNKCDFPVPYEPYSILECTSAFLLIIPNKYSRNISVVVILGINPANFSSSFISKQILAEYLYCFFLVTKLV